MLEGGYAVAVAFINRHIAIVVEAIFSGKVFSHTRLFSSFEDHLRTIVEIVVGKLAKPKISRLANAVLSGGTNVNTTLA